MPSFHDGVVVTHTAHHQVCCGMTMLMISGLYVLMILCKVSLRDDGILSDLLYRYSPMSRFISDILLLFVARVTISSVIGIIILQIFLRWMPCVSYTSSILLSYL